MELLGFIEYFNKILINPMELLGFIEYLVDFAHFCIPRCIPGWICRASWPPLGRVASALRADEVIFESADNQIFSSSQVAHHLLQRDSPNGGIKDRHRGCCFVQKYAKSTKYSMNPNNSIGFIY